ncbi:MAG TPA: hypothetical protein VMM36_02775 [Opitutaceae bacterium]|nr:hypothetical protein [Opitutaceae bacterium]
MKKTFGSRIAIAAIVATCATNFVSAKAGGNVDTVAPATSGATAQNDTADAGKGVETAAAAEVARTQRDVEARAKAAKEVDASAEAADGRAGASQSRGIAVSAGTAGTQVAIREITATTRDAVIKRVNATREEVSGILDKLRTMAAESRGAARERINDLVGNVRKAEAELASSIREIQRVKSEQVASKRDNLLEDYQAFVDAAAKAEATSGAGTELVTGQ